MVQPCEEMALQARSCGLAPETGAGLSVFVLLGRGSGESIQLRFAGEGWVVVQPYEEAALQARS